MLAGMTVGLAGVAVRVVNLSSILLRRGRVGLGGGRCCLGLRAAEVVSVVAFGSSCLLGRMRLKLLLKEGRRQVGGAG